MHPKYLTDAGMCSSTYFRNFALGLMKKEEVLGRLETALSKRRAGEVAARHIANRQFVRLLARTGRPEQKRSPYSERRPQPQSPHSVTLKPIRRAASRLFA